MPTMTKAELEAEIEKLKTLLDAKSKEEKFDECAREIRCSYLSFVQAGFTEEQAWEITKLIVNNGTAPKHSIF